MLCTIVICTKNSESSIFRCLSSIENEVFCRKILIDGSSKDRTLEIASLFDIEIFQGDGIGLTRDRQIGIELSETEFTLFIDSDHIVPNGFIPEMISIIKSSGSVLVQSRLRLFQPTGILNRGEDVYYKIVHNAPSVNIIPGFAPAIFRTNLFKLNQPLEVDDGKTKSIDDTNWSRKAIDLGFSIKIDGPCVLQQHESGLMPYVRKFSWYGKGDAEFCFSHGLAPAIHHLYHLLCRYPIVYSLRAIYLGYPIGVPFLVTQGLIRFSVCQFTILKMWIKKLGWLAYSW